MPKLFIVDWYTAISRKIVGKNVHAIIPKGNMGYDQQAVATKDFFESLLTL